MRWWGWWRHEDQRRVVPSSSSPMNFSSGVSSSSSCSSAAPSLTAQLLSVTESDLEQVRPEEVAALIQTLTPLELEQAMRMMLENQRFGEVMHACPPSTLREARGEVTNAYKLLLRPIFSEKLSLLYGVLPFIPSHYLEESVEL